MTLEQIRTALQRAGHNADRFLSNVRLTATDCLQWTGPHINGGYGRYRADTKWQPAHRWLYQALNGPLTKGLQLDHTCRNPGCVNPTHLQPVTPRENTLRGNTIAAHNAAKTQCNHGHAFTPANTIRRRNGARECLQCQTNYRQQRRTQRLQRRNQEIEDRNAELYESWHDIAPE